MRIEFVVTKWIGIHPMALVQPDKVASPADLKEIRRQPRHFTYSDWRRLDGHERRDGVLLGRPRVKLTSVAQMRRLNAQEPSVPVVSEMVSEQTS